MDEQKLLKRRRKAERENNETLLISACTDLANLYVEESRFDFAIEEYTCVSDIYKKQGKKLEYAVVNRGIGEAYLGLQKFDKALHHQKIYLDIARELKNKLEEQRALATIGHTYLVSYLESPKPDKNNLNLANKFFMKSLTISQNLSGASKLEIADMCARLFCNLGIVQDCLGNFDKASELFTKSINQCKAHDLYEQLQRAYMSFSSLLVKKGDSRQALQQCNLAVEATKKLRNKTILAGIYLSKSEILLNLGDLHGAKSVLHKAYKLKTPDTKERKSIENNLRIVVSMCNNEDTLLVTDSTNYPALKKLYEKMGDGACSLKLFTKAIDYYKKMLESAEKAEMTGSDLASSYYSLAETYKDNGQFKEAVEYFEKELLLCRSLKDSLNTLSNIADTKEAADESISEVKGVYNRAIESCQKEGNVHEEGRMVKRLILYLRRQKQHTEAFNLEQKLAKLDFHSSDSEGESSDAQTGSVVGQDVDLDAITDVSDDSEVDQPSTKIRRRTKNFQIKRNLKGETQLHSACIKGQLNVVSHLIEQGHPVNIRDNCGWLPLHEACIHGRFDIVKFLLDKGAAINDRGGTQCEGITPLHDAASNGHLTIVQLLLARGANAVAKTDNGETVLNFLKKWRSSVQLDPDNSRFYDSLVQEITRALDKAGQTVDQVETVDNRESTPTSMRRSTFVGLDSSPESSVSPPKLTDNDRMESQTSDYRNVIENLRRKFTKSPQKISQTPKRSALLTDDEMCDDWLEDDLGKTSKRRKTNSPIKAKHSPHKTRTESIIIDDSDSCQSNTSHSSPKKKKPKQAKLTNFGHTRIRVEPDSTCSPKPPESLPKLPRNRSFETATDPTLSVDVRIENKLYRVPILLSQLSTHTIKWLAEEASSRYAKKEYIVPTLELETRNGAILADDDPVSLLFPMGTSQADEVVARVVKKSLPALIERYKEACQDRRIEPPEKLCQTLQEVSLELKLGDWGLQGAILEPLFIVLNRQNNLRELDLSGNFLTKDSFELLSKSLSNLENLFKLRLSCTGLSSEHLQMIVSNLASNISYKILDLNLSDNWLKDDSFESLAILTRRFQLKKINLSGNKFTENLFNYYLNQNLTLNLDQVEEFDVSDNNFNNETLLKILSWLKFPNLVSLNVSRTSVRENFLRELLTMWNEIGKLQVCYMSKCHITDSEIFKLLRITNSLQFLDVSYNNELTSISLRRLLQSDITTLYIFGCESIFEYFMEFSSRHHKQGKTLRLTRSENCEKETEYLVQMWKGFYGDKTVVELSSKFLGLSVIKEL